MNTFLDQAMNGEDALIGGTINKSISVNKFRKRSIDMADPCISHLALILRNIYQHIPFYNQSRW